MISFKIYRFNNCKDSSLPVIINNKKSNNNNTNGFVIQFDIRTVVRAYN